MNYALSFTKPGTTLTFWLNKFYCGGHIWSLVRTRVNDTDDAQRFNQPALRFATVADAQAFIAQQLAGNPEVRVVEVQD